MLDTTYQMTASGRGMCVLVVDRDGNKIIDDAYDTFTSEGIRFDNMLHALRNGDHLLVAAKDEASANLEDNSRKYLSDMGGD